VVHEGHPSEGGSMLRFFIALAMINFVFFAIALILFYYIIDTFKQMSIKFLGVIILQLLDFLKEPLHLIFFLAFCIAMIIAHEIDENRKK
jgi:hypothetical protein